MTNGQTQDPKQGQGQSDPPSSGQDKLVALEARMAQIEKEAAEKIKAAEEARKNAEAEARKFQANLDSLRARVVTPPSQQLPQGQQTPAAQRLQELERVASEQAKQLLLHSETAKAGLTPAETEGITFDTPAQLIQAIEVIKMRKEIADLRSSRKSEGGSSSPEADTGGVTGKTGGAELSEEVRNLYDRSRKLGRTREARWSLLSAIHNDPSKLIPKG